MGDITNNIDAEKVDTSIKMINKYIEDSSITPFVAILEALKNDPGDTSLLVDLKDELNSLGFLQGAVLTYAPYIGVLLTGELLGDDLSDLDKL